ncbi:hypothetical protein GCM10023340_15860 [Nocardioides marinquilinus]|uniref:Uncharacterized protein n=1 Tax=Nocardioides marinquilinus TaxID=1210400 RepID=A0ABP9PFP6_9ACTN
MAGGKRAGARPKRRLRPGLLVLALGVTAAVVAWGYLVLAAIDFGATARGGDDDAWWFLGLASLGAVACLFLALLLLARIARAIGLTRPPERDDAASSTPSAPGGRRAAR